MCCAQSVHVCVFDLVPFHLLLQFLKQHLLWASGVCGHAQPVSARLHPTPPATTDLYSNGTQRFDQILLQISWLLSLRVAIISSRLISLLHIARLVKHVGHKGGCRRDCVCTVNDSWDVNIFPGLIIAEIVNTILNAHHTHVSSRAYYNSTHLPEVGHHIGGS